MDLDRFEQLVNERSERWSQAGILHEFERGPERDKSAAWVGCEAEHGVAQLIVWTSGEADLSWSDRRGDEVPEVQVEHYELTGDLGLIGALDDLEVRLGRAP